MGYYISYMETRSGKKRIGDTGIRKHPMKWLKDNREAGRKIIILYIYEIPDSYLPTFQNLESD
jgi:hypothetical protein